ncbi:MAG TPA: hypothetical protein VLA05_00935 [Coriobacteriia bacterium]|nr:hypothetical protein [Coriobacteriia bacterium]
MQASLAMVQAVIADAVRRRVIWVVLVFAALLALAVPSLPSYGDAVVSSVYREVTQSLMFVAALVVGLTLSATRVPNEVERRTVFSILARDVRRWQYVTATWVGIFAVTGVVLAAFAVISVVAGYFLYQEVMLVLFVGALAVWLEAGVVMALTVLLSTRFSPVTSIVGALAFLFVGHTWAGLLIPDASAQWWVPSLEVFNVISAVAHGSGVSFAYTVSMLVAFFAWAALLLLGAAVSFGGRDL